MTLATLNLALAAYMAGVIWVVQVVHYPLMLRVPAAAWPAYEAAHRTRITVVVLVPMVAQLVVGGHNVLLLDEPTNNLDPQAKEALLGALEQYRGSIVLVSHDTEFVAELAPDRAVLMPEGESAFFDEEMLDLVALA